MRGMRIERNDADPMCQHSGEYLLAVGGFCDNLHILCKLE